MGKPAALAHLEKNKLIDVQPNFVDTFNWLKDFCNNIEAKEPLEIDLTTDVKPIIKFKNEKTVEVITGVEFKIAEGKLMAKVKKEKFTLPADATSEETTTEIKIADVSEMNICVGNEYSTSTHQFKQFMFPALVLHNSGQTTNNVVFTATSHADEHKQG